MNHSVFFDLKNQKSDNLIKNCSFFKIHFYFYSLFVKIIDLFSINYNYFVAFSAHLMAQFIIIYDYFALKLLLFKVY